MNRVFVINRACYSRGMKFDLREYLCANGWEVVGSLDIADYIIMIACAADEKKERIVRHEIEVALNQKKPSAKFIVMGCLPKINRRLVSDLPEIIPIFQDDELDGIFCRKQTIDQTKSCHLFSQAYLDQSSRILANMQQPMRVINKLAPNSRTARICKRCFLFLSSRWLSIKPHRDERAYHLISNSGCAGQCTYCAIKFAIGPVKSKSLSVLKEEFERGLSLGYRYIRILSSDLKNYGQDTGDTTLELLECLTSSPADFMLSLTYLSPGWIIANFDEFLKILARRKIGKIFTTIQHGSQRVIDLMNRGYDIKKAQNCLRQINQKFPEIRLATSVIAGFPTETQAEVHETLEVLRSIRFMNVFINAYSDRPNTVSSEMPGKIPPEEIKRRCEYLSKNMMGNLVRGFLTDLIFDLTFDFGEGWKKARKKRSLGGNPQSAVGPWK